MQILFHESEDLALLKCEFPPKNPNQNLNKLFLKKYSKITFMCVHMHVCVYVSEGNLPGVCFLLLLCRSQGSNSGLQASQQTPSCLTVF